MTTVRCSRCEDSGLLADEVYEGYVVVGGPCTDCSAGQSWEEAIESVILNKE